MHGKTPTLQLQSSWLLFFSPLQSSHLEQLPQDSRHSATLPSFKTTLRHFSFPNVSPNQHSPSTRSRQRSFDVQIFHASHLAVYVFTSGSAVAHFRFKDEEGWEEEGEGDNTATAAAQVLSLDCTQLAASLDCLPLYTQLHLDTDIFTVGDADSSVCAMCYYCACVPVLCVMCAVCVCHMCVGIHSGQLLSLHSASPGHRYISLWLVMLTELCVCAVCYYCACIPVLCVACTLCVCVWASILDSLPLYTQLHLDTGIFTAGAGIHFMVGDAASCVCALCATTVHVCMYSVCTCVHYVCMYVCAICIHAL